MIHKIENEINKVFVGKEEVVRKLLTCMLAGGHVLLEDVPGVGKTTLAAALAGSMSCSFGRIQFTPDTLPGDIVGMSVYNMKSGEFEHRDGVVMHQILLADEINRTSPKTQASLLEAMAEGQVTVDGEKYMLPQPFMVIATQNPVEFLGTYPLPEAQMDRFMMRLSIGYPDREQELKMATQFLDGKTPDTIVQVCDAEDVLRMKREVKAIGINDMVLGYIEDLIAATREDDRFMLGASPRAMLALVRASQAHAYIEGRDYVKPDDVKEVAEAVLLHRLVLTSEAKIRKDDASKILRSILTKTKIPVA
ncbi:MAG: MoxR family ATPase [Clostridiales bacterium]|nr:MoxR family ATPase [Roseburia sp.]MDD7637153.1 MoxR family ATPase [Clostridiales bacterium]MDY4114080.1 MoxR family ATPase [Roseburia sp.]